MADTTHTPGADTNRSPARLGVSRQRLPKSFIRFGRVFRNVGLHLLEPLDYLIRMANGKRDLPPVYLRRYVGPLRLFEASGAEFVAHLKHLARLEPHTAILDIGCGCGLAALWLRDLLADAGCYVGFDIHAPSIRWCERTIQARHSNFRFERIDVRNATYNPLGAYRAEDYRFPLRDNSFDVALVKSVFTHMRPAEVENYFREVARILKPGGRCLATFFLLDTDPAQPGGNGEANLTFQFGNSDWRYEYQNSPESAIAYNEHFVTAMLTRQQLTVKQTLHGRWRQKPSGVLFQDVLLIEKPGAP